MLRNRLIFGTLMTLAFVGIVILDDRLAAFVDKYIEGTNFSVLVALLIILGLLELSKLAAAKGIQILMPVSMPTAVLFATWPYWDQFFHEENYWSYYFGPLLFALPVMLCFLYQRIRYGVSGTLANIGGACFSIMYLGLLGGFITAVRILFGPWHLLMLVFVVKCSDIGAYTFGHLFGKHKFSPVISPKKTWEGMIGAVIFAAVVAVGFAVCCGMMSWWSGVIFGVIFAFLGQLGDLAESMLKRDAEVKDSSSSVPGFGGILDVVDSLLVTAPFGYLFFQLVR